MASAPTEAHTLSLTMPPPTITFTLSRKPAFFNTSIPNNLAGYGRPVVLTVNPGEMTDEDAHLVRPIPDNLMFVRFRTNTWNTKSASSSAWATACPLRSEMSRSAEVPPMTTPMRLVTMMLLLSLTNRADVTFSATRDFSERATYRPPGQRSHSSRADARG